MEIKAGKNERNENVIVYESEEMTVTKTLMDGGWTHVFIEHADGTTEETFER